MKRALMILSAVGLLSLAACEEKKPAPVETTSSPATTTTTTTVTTPPAPVPVTISDSDLSTPADFEEAAEKSITKTNYKAELATLETDISKADIVKKD